MEKIATRNMFYDEDGKHVRTKKEILDEAGQLRNGCKIIPKGEAYERNIFTIKDRALVSGVPEKQILEVKQSEIGQKAKAFIQKSGRTPALFKSLIMTAKSEPVPEMRKKSELASKYLRLADIYNKLEKQNEAIY